MRILVPTDFSSTAERAFRLAAEVASKSKGSIIFLHINEKEEIPYFDSAEKKREYNEQLESKQLKRLQRLKRKVVKPFMNVFVSTIVTNPPVVNKILQVAKENHIDLIVMGTQGASGLKRTIVGSHASRVIEKSPIPVLVVPEKYDFKDPKEIVFATNYHKKDKPALAFTISLSKLFNAHVTVLHIQHVDLAERENAHHFSNYAYFLQRTFNDAHLKFNQVNSSNIEQTLEQLDENLPVDILVMVRRDKKFVEKIFLKSFTRNMSCTSTLPLLVIPEIEK
jgi:nucleotide-binding universal stress UspA family protein